MATIDFSFGFGNLSNVSTDGVLDEAYWDNLGTQDLKKTDAVDTTLNTPTDPLFKLDFGVDKYLVRTSSPVMPGDALTPTPTTATATTAPALAGDTTTPIVVSDGGSASTMPAGAKGPEVATTRPSSTGVLVGPIPPASASVRYDPREGSIHPQPPLERQLQDLELEKKTVKQAHDDDMMGLGSQESRVLGCREISAEEKRLTCMAKQLDAELKAAEGALSGHEARRITTNVEVGQMTLDAANVDYTIIGGLSAAAKIMLFEELGRKAQDLESLKATVIFINDDVDAAKESIHQIQDQSENNRVALEQNRGHKDRVKVEFKLKREACQRKFEAAMLEIGVREQELQASLVVRDAARALRVESLREKKREAANKENESKALGTMARQLVRAAAESRPAAGKTCRTPSAPLTELNDINDFRSPKSKKPKTGSGSARGQPVGLGKGRKNLKLAEMPVNESNKNQTKKSLSNSQVMMKYKKAQRGGLKTPLAASEYKTVAYELSKENEALKVELQESKLRVKELEKPSEQPLEQPLDLQVMLTTMMGLMTSVQQSLTGAQTTNTQAKSTPNPATSTPTQTVSTATQAPAATSGVKPPTFIEIQFSKKAMNNAAMPSVQQPKVQQQTAQPKVADGAVAGSSKEHNYKPVSKNARKKVTKLSLGYRK